MSILVLIALSLQPAPPVASPDGSTDARRETVIAAPSNEASRTPPALSRIRRRAPPDIWVVDSTAAMYLREWAACTVRNNRSASVALLATQINSPGQDEVIDRLTGRRFTRRTVCARFRAMRVDNLVLRGAIAEALQRWEEDRRRQAGPLMRPAPRPAADSIATLAQAGYCITERQPEGVRRVMATRLGTRHSESAVEALRDAVNDCLPSDLQATDFHPMLLRGALGEPYLLSRRAPRPGDGAVTPAT